MSRGNHKNLNEVSG